MSETVNNRNLRIGVTTFTIALFGLLGYIAGYISGITSVAIMVSSYMVFLNIVKPNETYRKPTEQDHAAILQMATRRKLSLRSYNNRNNKYYSD